MTQTPPNVTPTKTATLHGTGHRGTAGGYATHGSPVGRLGGCYCPDRIVTTRLNCCRQHPQHGTDRGDARHKTRSNCQLTFLG